MSELAHQLATGSWPANLRQWVLLVLERDSPGHLGYAALAALCWLFVAWLALDLPAWPRARWPWLRHPASYGLALLLGVLASRWPELAYGGINIDEDFFLAGAMALQHDPVPWRSIDLTTTGPLVGYLLLLPSLVGVTPDHGTARLLGLLLQGGSVVFLYRALATVGGERAARLAVLPAAWSAAMYTSMELIIYTSEKLPIFLLSGSLWLLARAWRAAPPRVWGWLLACSVVLALVPLAKLQGAPLTLLLGLVGALVIILRPDLSRRQRPLAWLALLGGGTLVAAGLFALLRGYGVLDNFVVRYLSSNFVYVQTDAQSWPARAAYWGHQWQTLPELHAWVWAGGLILVCLALGAWSAGRRRGYRPVLALAVALLFCLTVAYTVLASGRTYFHYSLWLLWGLGVIGGLALLLTRNSTQPAAAVAPAAASVRAWRPALLLAALLAMAGAFLAQRLAHPPRWATTLPIRIDGSNVALAILQVARPGEALAVWGWENRYHTQTGMWPCTPEPASEHETNPGPLQEYYLRAYVAALARQPPPVFLDVVGPRAFFFKSRELDGHEHVPALAALIDQLYILSADLDGVRIYVRRDRVTAHPLAPPASP